ncbi:MAG: FkbM family methyltransferase [Actinomycetota bacterium]|nr:FkbM family methyltransferase [Actinomycetota bacterium]
MKVSDLGTGKYNAPPVIDVLRRSLRAAKNALVPDKVVIRTIKAGFAKGAKLPMNLRYKSHVWMGLYEKEVADWMQRAVKPDTIFYDLGAGYGYYAAAVGLRASMGKVYAFEFDPTQVPLLRQAIKANQLGKIIEVFELEVSDRTVEGRSITLDDFMADHSPLAPTLVKLDVEGAEYRILQGASRMVTEHKPTFFIETHSEQVDDECAELLRSAGYALEFREQDKTQYGPRPIDFNRWIWAEHPDRGV